MERFELTMGQKVLLTSYHEEDFCVNLVFALRIEGNLDKDKFKQVLQKIINDNDAFRFKFYKDKQTGLVYQYADEQTEYTLDEREAKGNTYDEKYEDVKEQVREILSSSQCFSDTLMWDFVLFDMGNDEHIFYVRMNHLICDGVTIAAAIGYIVSLYNDIPMRKSLGFSDFIREQQAFEKTEQYMALREKYSPQLDEFKNYKRILQFPEKGRDYAIINYFTTIDCDKISGFCKENKLSFFHASLFFYHAAISAIYKRKDTLVTVPMGTRKSSYMNSIGYLLSICYSRMIFEDDMGMQDAAIKCRNNFFESTKTIPVFFEAFLNNNYAIEFALTYQNQAGNFDKKIFLGEAEVKSITDPDFIGNTQKVIMDAVTVSVMEVKDKIIYAVRAGMDIYSNEMRDKTAKAFELAAECLSGKDMTFGEFCRALDSM
ncbi:MAG: condensation domain-containing protein [Muricomes sp.]